MWYIHAIKYYGAIREDEVTHFTATWIELEGIEVREIERRTNIRVYHSSVV